MMDIGPCGNKMVVAMVLSVSAGVGGGVRQSLESLKWLLVYVMIAAVNDEARYADVSVRVSLGLGEAENVDGGD